MKDAKKIAQSMARLNAKAEKLNPKCTIRMKRLIKQYMARMDALYKALRKFLPLSATDEDVMKMQDDMITWAEQCRKDRYGRRIQTRKPHAL